MNTQYLALILLGLIAASNFVDLKNFFKKDEQEAKKEDLPAPLKPVYPESVAPAATNELYDSNILGAVKRWQALKDYCDREKLSKASQALSDLFPLLAEKESKQSVQ